MSYLRSVPTYLRMYRGVVESLGTYERLEVAIRRSLHEQELDHRASYPAYIGASLLSKGDFSTMRRNNAALRAIPVEHIANDVAAHMPRSKDMSYDVRLTEATVRGNPREGYTLGATFDSDIFDIEKHAVYRALATVATNHLPVAEDYWIKFCHMMPQFSDHTVAALQSQLPRMITLEPIRTAIFSGNHTDKY